MEKKPNTTDNPSNGSRVASDLVENYGPIGLKAVLSATLTYRTHGCGPGKTADDINIHLLSRLSNVAGPDAVEIEVEGNEKRKDV